MILKLLIGFSSTNPKLDKEKYFKNTLIQKGKKKVLIYSYRLEAGGIGKSLFTILKNFDYSKYEIDLVLITKFGTPVPEFKEIPKEINIIYLYSPFFKFSKPDDNKLMEFLKKVEFFFFEKLIQVYKNSNWLTYNWKLKNKKYDIEVSLFYHTLDFLINSPL